MVRGRVWISRHRIAAAAVAIALLAAGGVGGTIAARALGGHVKPPLASHGGCPPSGCATVALSRTLPPFTVFYGGSCTGLRGSWFFNVVEGGGDAQPRPSYALKWAFSGGSSEARPSGRIVVSPTRTSQATLTLTQGALSLSGSRSPDVNVSAVGTLVVSLSGSSGAPALEFTEIGLKQAEDTLGLISPFDLSGQPLTVPVETVKTMAGC